MYISKAIKLVLSTLTIGSLVGGGGYLAKTFLSNKEDQNNFSKVSWKGENKGVLSESSIKTEYIRKEFMIGNSERQNCEIIKKGNSQEEILNKDKCEDLIEKIWGKNKEKQPDIWLRTDLDTFEEEMNNYPNLKEETNSIELNKDWKTEGNILGCSSYLEIKNVKKVVISCNYLIGSNSVNLLELINRV